MKQNIQIYVDPEDSRYAQVWIVSDTGRNETYRVRRSHPSFDKIESALDSIRISAIESTKAKKEREEKERNRVTFHLGAPQPAFRQQ